MSNILTALLAAVGGMFGNMPRRENGDIRIGLRPSTRPSEAPEWFKTRAGGRMQANGVKKRRNRKGRKR